MPKIKCAACGNEFEVKTSRARFCSQNCRQKVWREKAIGFSKAREDFFADSLAEINQKLDRLIEYWWAKEQPSPKVVDNYKTLHDAIQSAKIYKEILDLEDQVKLNKFLTRQQKDALLQLSTLKINAL